VFTALVVLVEGFLLVTSGLPLWFERTARRPTGPPPLLVRVVAEQFAWNIHYPGPDGEFGESSVRLISPENPLGLDRKSRFAADDVTSVGEMVLPVNQPVLVELSSKDVIHSFGIPAMRVKQDATPGIRVPVWFTPTEIGEFEIACSQLCGMAHYRMRGIVRVVAREEYEGFLRR
jgi:cytochrome c oxidase subunit 2